MITRKEVNESEPPEPSIKELINKSIIVINKPRGPFSYEITDLVKKTLRVKKTGHAGTLDPNATGVLPIGINKGCHVLQAISHASKMYEGVMHLHSDTPLSLIVKTKKKFVGKIIQTPPVRSAVKRVPREREIYSISIDDLRGRDLLFTVECEAGTYIRKLVVDWAEAMNTRAHLKELTRIKAGPYTIKDAVSIDEFLNNPTAHLLRIETAVKHLPHVWVDDNTTNSIKNGSQPFLPGVYKYDENIKKGDLIAIFTTKQELLALATALMNSDEMSGDKGMVAKLRRVIT